MMTKEKEQAAVVILGTRNNECEEVKLVQELGYKAILFDLRIELHEALAADFPLEIDLNNESLVIDEVEKLKNKFDIAGIYTLNEYRLTLCSKISEILGFKNAMSHQGSINCRNKKFTRNALKGTRWEIKYKLITHEKEVLNALEDFEFPVVVKPSNESGSSMVMKCNSFQDVWDAVSNIRMKKQNLVGQMIDSDILIEEYIEGSEYSVESFTINNETTILAVTEKQTAHFNPTVEVGHIVPAPIKDKDFEEVSLLVKETLRLLNINNGVTHTEIKLTNNGPRLIEVNARPGGDRIPDLVATVTGIDLRKLSLQIILGEIDQIKTAIKSSNFAAIRFLAAPKSGTLYYEMNDFNRSLHHSFFYHPGSKVSRTTSNYSRLGYFIVEGETYEDIKNKIKQTEEQLQINIR
ncbi:ATP-grasp domain-containing protein [Bacillus subtilis]|uniref:ATP-grasp domain-containing protein n=1 Tax=Bacillus subtilis TaxID=1423 RepID=UPI00137CC02B|nr:ATP-grasp domain-containing protein [Bacillus licheniformis]TWK57274.1 Dapdiamide A synthase [Bacillus licheniformis]